MMSKSVWALLTCAALLFVVSRPALQAAAAKGKPNVIVILTDDQGYGDLGCTGNDIIQTPNIDALWNDSIRLTDFHVNSVCSPSRAALLSGRHASAVGVWHTLAGRDLMRADAVIMPQAFAANGYRTFMAGKWHLGDNHPFRPEDRGFEQVYRIGGGSPGQIADYWGNGLFNTRYWNGTEWETSKGFCTDRQLDSLIRFIDEPKDAPFFIYWATTAMHSPVGAPDEYLAKYADLDKERQTFYGMVSNLDWNVGRLRAALKQRGLNDNTILIYLSDNGSACDKKGKAGAYNAGLRGKKGSVYEGGHRVPCLIHWPDGKLTGGSDRPQLAAHFDLFPTLTELCGIAAPKSAAFDGHSLAPLLKNPDHPWPDRTLITEAKVNKRSRPYDSSAIMSGPWRLVNQGRELYDLRNDPGQTTDVAAKRPTQVARLRKSYEDWYETLEPGFSDVARIVIGSPRANPVRLTSMDVHAIGDAAGKTVWNQKGVLTAARHRGLWKLQIARAGDYRISLRRWPAESGLKFADTPRNGTPVTYQEARLRIGGHKLTLPVDASSEQITFSVSLKAGPTDLDAVLVTDDGNESTAYFVVVGRE
jgi:arylsulfatase A-like enzyme